MKGRPTNDPKYYRINLRVNEEMLNEMKLESARNGQTIAEYVRGVIKERQNYEIDTREFVRKCDESGFKNYQEIFDAVIKSMTLR